MAEDQLSDPHETARSRTLAGLGITAEPFTDGMDAYVRNWETEMGAAAWKQLAGFGDDVPILVGTYPGNVQAVLASDTGLLAEGPQPWVEPTRRREPGEVVPVTVGEVRRLQRPGAPLLVADQACSRTVIGWQPYTTDTGHRTQWAVALSSWWPESR